MISAITTTRTSKTIRPRSFISILKTRADLLDVLNGVEIFRPSPLCVHSIDSSGPIIHQIIPLLLILSKRARELGGGKLAHIKMGPLIRLGG